MSHDSLKRLLLGKTLECRGYRLAGRLQSPNGGENTASRLACSCFQNSSGLLNVEPTESTSTCRFAHTADKHL